jgi:DNA invertase Pin-like site-specific DNA recombinase
MYCLYLRKSRADLVAEARGEGETLAKHEHILMDTARHMGLSIGAVYKELVSGESIQDRPVMQKLLSEVSSGMWQGVLVVEVERLARGDTQDQGVVAKAFKYSNTLIITPIKTYDPNDEFDEEYFEFGLFMSRREYKTINRRMRRGVIQAVRDGYWPYNRAPYGYDVFRLPDKSGYSLAENPNEKHIYRMLIRAAAYGVDGSGIRLGDSANAKRLNSLGLLSRSGKPWTPAGVRAVRTNPVHTGKVVYGRRSHVKKLQDGSVTRSRPRNSDYQIYPGVHQALIDEVTWKAAQRPFTSGIHVNHKSNGIQNPLSGIVKCGLCGRNMVRRPYKNHEAGLICPYTDCKNVSTTLSSVEEKLLEAIEEWVKGYEIISDEINTDSASLEMLHGIMTDKEKELEKISAKRSKQYDLLEQGIYTPEVFLERSAAVEKELTQMQNSIQGVKDQIAAEEMRIRNQSVFIPQCKKLLDGYSSMDAAEKNAILKELVDHITYTKPEKNKRGHGSDVNFTLDVYPKLPEKP